MSRGPPHAVPGGGRVVRPIKLAAVSAAKQAASARACEQQRLSVENKWMGRVESPPSRRDLCYQQRSREKLPTAEVNQPNDDGDATEG